jgi:hypothetical protein
LEESWQCLVFTSYSLAFALQLTKKQGKTLVSVVEQHGKTSVRVVEVDKPSPSHNVELALYADEMAITATSRKPTLLVNYLESYLNDLQRWVSEIEKKNK